MRKNGVKQGAVLSGTLYCFFCNQFFQRLRNSKSGCWINQHYLGIFGYSDDNFLLAPSLSALQDMLKICEEYAKEHGLKFSTDPNPQKMQNQMHCISTERKRIETSPTVWKSSPLGERWKTYW